MFNGQDFDFASPEEIRISKKTAIQETPHHDSFPVKTILVVEDDDALGAFFMEAIIQETPHHAVRVTDGYHALKVVNDLTPHLLLLDYILPQMNGIELYDHLCTKKEFKNIPAIMVSAHCPWQEARDRNMICIQKPVDLGAFLKTIEKLLT